MAEEKININGLEINYKIAGQGPAILVLHGWGGSSDSWMETQKILSQEYRVVIPDLPGFGKSAPPANPWGVGDYMDFVLKFTQRLNLEKFFLIGHSFGGRISIKFTGKYPERVKSLILCDSAGIKPKPGLKTIIIFWLARTGNAVFTPRIFKRFKDSVRNLFYVLIRNRDYAKANGVMKETIKRVLSEDLLLELSDIKKKTLIVWGEVDRMVPLKYAYIFKEKIEGARLETLPKIGHSPHLEVPRKFSEIILKFIKEDL